MFQDNLRKSLVALEIAKEEVITDGTTKNLPYINYQKPVQYTKYTAVNSVAAKTGNDQIVINQTPMIPFEIDRIDMDDNYLDVTPELISSAGYMLKSAIDGDVLNQTLQAANVYNANGLNGDGTAAPVELSLTTGTGYIPTVFGSPKSRLLAAWVNASRLAMAVDSQTVDDLSNLGIEKWFNVADEAIARGYRGTFKGMAIYETNNLTATRTLALATNPTADDTITILGVNLKFVSTLADAGDVLIGADVAATTANLIAAVNGDAGAGTTYVEIEEPAVFAGITASVVTGGVLFTSLTGRMYASSKLTASDDKFGAESVESLITEKGAIRFAIRNNVEIKQDSDSDSLVEKFKVWSRYGVATPSRWKTRMCRVSIQWAAAE